MVFLSLVSACSSDETPGNDPPGFTCEYRPFGNGTASYAVPTPEQLGEFDFFVRVRVTGHRQLSPRANIYNLVTVEDAVFGPVSDGDKLELADWEQSCLETGKSYYVLFDEPGVTGFSFLASPWKTFPVINNRITLHPDMRKDELIGRFHGLDPVLFKRRFVEFVGREDIQVD